MNRQRLLAIEKRQAQPRKRTVSDRAAEDETTSSDMDRSGSEPLMKSLQTFHEQHENKSDQQLERTSRHSSLSEVIDTLRMASSVGGSQSMSIAALDPDVNLFRSESVLSEGSADARIKEAEDDDDSGEPRSCCRTAGKKFSGASDLPLFGSPIFWLLILYHYAGCFSSGLPSAFLPFLAREKGLTATQGALLVTISGALDILSRLVPGILAQSKLVKPQTSVIVSMLIIGVMFQFTNFANGMVSLTLMSITYGLFSGVIFSMMALIILDFSDLERFRTVFGINQLAMGIGAATGYPIIGEYCARYSALSISPYALAALQASHCW